MPINYPRSINDKGYFVIFKVMVTTAMFTTSISYSDVQASARAYVAYNVSVRVYACVCARVCREFCLSHVKTFLVNFSNNIGQAMNTKPLTRSCLFHQSLFPHVRAATRNS